METYMFENMECVVYENSMQTALNREWDRMRIVAETNDGIIREFMSEFGLEFIAKFAKEELLSSSEVWCESMIIDILKRIPKFQIVEKAITPLCEERFMTEHDCERNGNGVRIIEYNAGIEYVATEDEQINSMMELMGATEIHDMNAPDNWVCWEY